MRKSQRMSGSAGSHWAMAAAQAADSEAHQRLLTILVPEVRAFARARLARRAGSAGHLKFRDRHAGARSQATGIEKVSTGRPQHAADGRGLTGHRLQLPGRG